MRIFLIASISLVAIISTLIVRYESHHASEPVTLSDDSAAIAGAGQSPVGSGVYPLVRLEHGDIGESGSHEYLVESKSSAAIRRLRTYEILPIEPDALSIYGRLIASAESGDAESAWTIGVIFDRCTSALSGLQLRALWEQGVLDLLPDNRFERLVTFCESLIAHVGRNRVSELSVYWLSVASEFGHSGSDLRVMASKGSSGDADSLEHNISMALMEHPRESVFAVSQLLQAEFGFHGCDRVSRWVTAGALLEGLVTVDSAVEAVRQDFDPWQAGEVISGVERLVGLSLADQGGQVARLFGQDVAACRSAG